MPSTRIRQGARSKKYRIFLNKKGGFYRCYEKKIQYSSTVIIKYIMDIDTADDLLERTAILFENLDPFLEKERLRGMRLNRASMGKGMKKPKKVPSTSAQRVRKMILGGHIPSSNNEYLLDPNRNVASRKVKGHLGYKIDSRNKRICKGPVINKNSYRSHFSMPELGHHHWMRRKENALKAGNGDIIWENLHRKGKTLRNPWHGKKKIEHMK